MQGFQSFFLHHFVLAKLATSSIRVNLRHSESLVGSYHRGIYNLRYHHSNVVHAVTGPLNPLDPIPIFVLNVQLHPILYGYLTFVIVVTFAAHLVPYITLSSSPT